MHQPISRVIVLFSLFCLSACVHVAFDLSGWKAIPLEDKRVAESIAIAVEHLGGTLNLPVTAFKLEENLQDWDLYRVSFIGRSPQGKAYECHADTAWIHNQPNVTVFNEGCLASTLIPDIYSNGH